MELVSFAYLNNTKLMCTYNEALESLRSLLAILENIRGGDAEVIEKEIIEPLESTFSHIYVEDENGAVSFANRTTEFLSTLQN